MAKFRIVQVSLSIGCSLLQTVRCTAIMSRLRNHHRHAGYYQSGVLLPIMICKEYICFCSRLRPHVMATAQHHAGSRPGGRERPATWSGAKGAHAAQPGPAQICGARLQRFPSGSVYCTQCTAISPAMPCPSLISGRVCRCKHSFDAMCASYSTLTREAPTRP